MTGSFAAPRPIAMLVAIALVACHRTPSSPVRSAELEGTVGDSTMFGARVLDLDRARHRATFSLAAPAYVMLLLVAPGRSIDPLWIDSAATPSLVPAETRTTRLPVPGAAARSRAEAQGDDLPVAVRVEIDRCVRQAVASAERARRRPPRVIRDSAGREIRAPERPEPVDPSVERNARTACTRSYGSRPGATPVDTHERYLVLLASSVPMGPVELAARLNGLTVTAEDARTTIAAIAEGLFFDRQAIWSGYYVRW